MIRRAIIRGISILCLIQMSCQRDSGGAVMTEEEKKYHENALRDQAEWRRYGEIYNEKRGGRYLYKPKTDD
jgi:hypothetical protein